MMNLGSSLTLEAASMYPLHLERDSISAHEVFHDPRASEDILNHSRQMGTYQDRGRIPVDVEAINAMAVMPGYVPEDLSNQELSGYDIIRQARLILNSPFFRAIASHPHIREVHGFLKAKLIIRDTLYILNLLRDMGNLFRPHKIHTVLGSRPEVNSA